MYTAYQKDIEKYIIERTEYDRIKDYNGILKLARGYHYIYIEAVYTSNIAACVRYMVDSLGMDYVISRNKILVCDVVFNEQLNCNLGICCWYLNDCPLLVSGNRGLLLFLLDPLMFIERNWKNISTLEDCHVRTFLLDLKCRAENIKSMHIKCSYIMDLHLVDDIKKLVVDQYIALVINKNKIIKWLDGSRC